MVEIKVKEYHSNAEVHIFEEFENEAIYSFSLEHDNLLPFSYEENIDGLKDKLQEDGLSEEVIVEILNNERIKRFIYFHSQDVLPGEGRFICSFSQDEYSDED